MKHRISISDIEALTLAQRESLRDIWIPEKYDIAVSSFCIDAVQDKYKWIEFAIGEVYLKLNGKVILRDLRLTDGFVKLRDPEVSDKESYELHEPTSFLKSDSLPLLTIGQMITMLHLLDKKRYHFYLLSGNADYACEIGDFNSELKSNILAKSNVNDELVDVLWSTLKQIL